MIRDFVRVYVTLTIMPMLDVVNMVMPQYKSLGKMLYFAYKYTSSMGPGQH